MRARVASLVLAGLTLFCGACGSCGRGPEGGRIEGRVVWEGLGVGSALVGAYPGPEEDPRVAAVAEVGSDRGGRFRLDLPPGRYWVRARATSPGGGRATRLTGEARGNPVVVVAGRRTEVGVDLVAPAGFSPRAGPLGSGVTGRVAGRDEAAAGKTVVCAYPGHRERPLGPGFDAATPVSDDGSFRLDLPSGSYTLAARWRGSGEGVGDLAPGDRVAFAPIEVGAAGYASAGTLTLRPVDETRLRGTSKGSPRTTTAVCGTVVDTGGNPVGGVRVLAFPSPRMKGKPAALSSTTGPDGAFVVYLPGRGTYFLGARSRVGGPAEPGEKVGAHRGRDGAGLPVEDGEVLGGLEITVEELW